MEVKGSMQDNLYDGSKCKEEDNYSFINRVVFYAGLKCNLNCKHCYVKGSFSDCQLSLADRFYILDKILSLHKPIDITGGEPLLCDDLLDIINKIFSDHGIVSSIFTNATLIGQKRDLVNEILNIAGSLNWFISLDGNLEAHDCFRGIGTFADTIRGAEILMNNNQDVLINTMLHSAVNKKVLKDLYDIIKKNGYKRWRIDSPFVSGAWTNNKEKYAVAYKKQVEMLTYIMYLWLNDNMPFEIELGHVAKYIGEKLYFLDQYDLDAPICPCRSFPVWPDGNVSWCQDLSDAEYVIGNLFQDDLAYIYNRYVTYKTVLIKDVANSNSTCLHCVYLSNCGMGCRMGAIGYGTGYYGADANLCALYKEQLFLPILDELKQYITRKSGDKG